MLDCGIRGFFDAIVHEWLMKLIKIEWGFVGYCADTEMASAGISEEGEWSNTVVGTPQGSVISPFLANCTCTTRWIRG